MNPTDKPRKLSVYQRIVLAAHSGKGVCLSPDEVQDLAADDAISTRAEEDSEVTEP
jgi:hypothetical protein